MKQWIIWIQDAGRIAMYAWNAELCARVAAAIEAYLAAYEAYETVKTPEHRLDKDVKQKAAVSQMRNFANQSIRFNEAMSEQDKLHMGIAPADTTSTAQTAPTSQPDTDVLPTSNHFEHVVRALNHDTARPVKPEDAYGVRYAWQVGGEKPGSGANIAKTKLSRKTRFVVSYTEEEKGKTAYYSTCYENSKGDQGTWSPVVEALIA
jgi:hypothetical protein